MLKEAMYKRHSRRSYLREKLRDEDAAFLKERIHMYNQKHGLHMKLVCGHPEIFKGFRNSYGMFHNVENFIMMMGNSRDVYMQEKLGYFGERLILEAVARNLGTCWVGGTFAKAAYFISFNRYSAVVVKACHINSMPVEFCKSCCCSMKENREKSMISSALHLAK